MNVIILGSGRVGAAIANDLVARDHAVTVIDRDPDSLLRLGGDDFRGNFEVGEGLDSELLERAGIDYADAFIASTDDDNTNLVIAQIAHRRYHVGVVVVRVFDPDKAAFYSKRGMRVVCPTLRAISEMIRAVDREAPEAESIVDASTRRMLDELHEATVGGPESSVESQPGEDQG